MNATSLRVSVPVCSFRRPYAREYLETERIPPPATVYGFLLSLVGEEMRSTYEGTLLAIAVTGSPLVSQVLRTTWRIKSKDSPPGIGNNRKPDYQEMLTGLELGIWIAEGELAARVRKALIAPDEIRRYGGLSLGESRDLVNEVVLEPNWDNRHGQWLVSDKEGEYPLPVWVDHVGSAGTRWIQVKTIEDILESPPESDARWIKIISNQ